MSGLSTAAFLSKAGKKVLVLERHFKVGGWTHTFQRGQYEWDVGIHYIGAVGRKNASYENYLMKSQMSGWSGHLCPIIMTE
jgi:all-trans-retinol 13,14-reductase